MKRLLFAFCLVACGGSLASEPLDAGTDVGDGWDAEPISARDAATPCPRIASRGKPVTVEVETTAPPTNLTLDAVVASGTYALASHVSYVAADAAVPPPMTYAMTLEVANGGFGFLREEGGTITMGTYDLVRVTPEDPLFVLLRTCGDGPAQYRFVTLHRTTTGFDLMRRSPTGAEDDLHFESVP